MTFPVSGVTTNLLLPPLTALVISFAGTGDSLFATTLVRELRGLPTYKYTPLLVLTTEATTERKQAGKAAGATGWLVKPFNPERLLATIAKVLG